MVPDLRFYHNAIRYRNSIDDNCSKNHGKESILIYKYLYDNYHELSRKVVFTTGDITGKKVSEFLDISERVFLQKPFTPRELLAAVELAMN